MGCKHDRIKCTNNIFYCLDCGACLGGENVVLIPADEEPWENVSAEEKPVKSPKKPVKRKAKKEE